MGEDFHARPIPIRLTCRYDNGIVISYYGQALAYDDSSLQVLSAETFEEGVQLRVLAPFIDGVAYCQVLGSSRRRGASGGFELTLKVLSKITPRAKREKSSSEDLSQNHVVSIAEELAARLEQDDKQRFSRVLREFPEEQHSLLVAITAAGLSFLLQEKEHLDLRHLVRTFEQRAAL